MFPTYHDVFLVAEGATQQASENLQNLSRVDFGARVVGVSFSSMVFLLKILIPHSSCCRGVSTACREFPTKALRLGVNRRLKLHNYFDPDRRYVFYFCFVCLSLGFPVASVRTKAHLPWGPIQGMNKGQKINKSSRTKYLSLKPHRLQLLMKITLRMLKMDELFYELFTINIISSISEGQIKKPNGPLMAPGS